MIVNGVIISKDKNKFLSFVLNFHIITNTNLI